MTSSNVLAHTVTEYSMTDSTPWHISDFAVGNLMVNSLLTVMTFIIYSSQRYIRVGILYVGLAG